MAERRILRRPTKPLGERADQLAERGRSGEPCFVLKRWVYTVGKMSQKWSVVGGVGGSLFQPGRPASTKNVVVFRQAKNLPSNVDFVGFVWLGILEGLGAWLTNSTVWVRRRIAGG